MATSPLGPTSSVGAHSLLNSCSVLLLATAALRDNWERLSDHDRVDMLDRLVRHAEILAAGLKQLVQTGGDPIGTLPDLTPGT